MGTPTELVREGFRRNDAGDIDGFVELQAPDCEWLTPQGVLRGRDEVRAFVATFRGAFPEGVHALDDIHEVGDATVVVQGRWSGMQTGPLAGPDGEMPATGRHIEMPFALVVEGDLEAQQAKRVAIYHDQLGFMTQLGLMPEPAAA